MYQGILTSLEGLLDDRDTIHEFSCISSCVCGLGDALTRLSWAAHPRHQGFHSDKTPTHRRNVQQVSMVATQRVFGQGAAETFGILIDFTWSRNWEG